MSKSLNILFAAAAFLGAVSAQADGLTLSGTRLIYDATKKEASINLNNQGKSPPQLVQSWVSDKNRGVKDIPFIITPPVSKLSPNATATIRVVYVGGNVPVPDDRESLWLLNVRAVPATEKKDNPARLTIATQNVIKLIYRPAGLTSAAAAKAGESLTVSPVASGVRFANPTPYVVTLSGVTINGKAVERPGTLEPEDSLTLPFKEGSPARVTWRTINDFGGLTKENQVHF
ncbi:fimbrial biogenesis chaperone [Klebsiella oxytoca]|uniref:fimbrial biogenesis chaperone n=1 Tax=Klebsiella oxytoca TaxID=571 RepID=UPI0006653190|nr:molecular chaperone [Klebsiella oxytoca]